jgi:1,4-alpha-glucan branching enzyme
MHDVLDYFGKDPIHRRFHHNDLTFSLLYAFHENFILALSHDEMVHGKGSLLSRMPGDPWQKFANLRALYGYMWGHPGKKLLFMGGEFGQWNEWASGRSLDWHLLDYPTHQGLRRWVADLNRLYRAEPALHEVDFRWEGFEWIDCHDGDSSVLSFIRWDAARARPVIVVCNFTPVPRHRYRIGVPRGGAYVERLNGDATCYGGSGLGNGGRAAAEAIPWHGRPHSLVLTLPPLAVLFLAPE